jgi:hypothetical protein
MDSPTLHPSRRLRAAAMPPHDRTTPVPLRGRVRAATVATAALICAVAALAASLPPAIAWASTGAQIPASALINDLKLAGAVGVDNQAAPVITPPTILGVTLGTLPTATEPAAFAAGSVAVSIIFPQSSGAGGTKHTEDWAATDAYGTAGLTSADYPNLTPRQVYIVGEIQKTLSWWEAQAPAAVHLRFVIPSYKTKTLGYPREYKVAREPITIASTNDQAWRHPIMAKLRFKAAGTTDSPPPETAYDNAVRKANHTDWAFTVYVVDSLNDHDKTPGAFPNGAFAYTYDLFGPYTVTTYDNSAYTPANFDGVLAHEIGHVFGALDEYAAPAGYPSSGGLYSGYLWVRNSNAVQGGTTHDVCIMRGGAEGLAAYKGTDYPPTPLDKLVDGGICPSTRGQIGWRVTPPNTLPDVVDTKPTLVVKPPVSTDASTVTIAGSARENAWPPGHKAKGRAFARGISILVPHDVQYSVDGGAPTAVSTSGSGATKTFSFSVDTSALGTGPYAQAPTRHLVTVQATTGTTASMSEVAWAYPTPVGLSLTLTSPAATIALGAKASLRLHAADADDPEYSIGHLVSVSVGPSGAAAANRTTLTTGAAGNAAATFTPSHTTTYQATFTPGPLSPEFTATATQATVTVAVRARLTAHAGTPSAAGVVPVSGTFRPLRSGVPITLQQSSGGAWRTVARTQTSASATFRLHYAAPAGTVRLRVRFAGDARNAAATRLLPALVVP